MQTDLKKAAAGVHAVIDQGADAVLNAADEAARQLKPVIERTSHVVHEAIDKAGTVPVPALDWEWLSAKADDLSTARGEFVARGRKVITDHPWQAVGAVLALGLLIGRVLR